MLPRSKNSAAKFPYIFVSFCQISDSRYLFILYWLNIFWAKKLRDLFKAFFVPYERTKRLLRPQALCFILGSLALRI